mgnify:CR=1 FL=1|jgi:hypothetical protein
MLMVKHVESPEGAEAGYVYDSIRQQQNKQSEQVNRCKKLKKKIDKLSGKNRNFKLKR